jgi:hypothetical protein
MRRREFTVGSVARGEYRDGHFVRQWRYLRNFPTVPRHGLCSAEPARSCPGDGGIFRPGEIDHIGEALAGSGAPHGWPSRIGLDRDADRYVADLQLIAGAACTVRHGA